jgi:hypothetical protein
MGDFTPGPYSRHTYSNIQERRTLVSDGEAWEAAAITIGAGNKIVGEVKFSTSNIGFPSVDAIAEMEANAALWIAAPDLVAAIEGLEQFFQRNEETSIDKFDRVAEQFRKDAPASYGGEDDYDARREAYDAWVASKIDAARAAIAQAKGEA